MKKINFLTILICIGVLAACNSTGDKYVIKGVVHDHIADGDVVYIYDFNDGSIIDSTKIASGKFFIEGDINDAKAVRLVVEHHHVNFILEKGNITIDMIEEPYKVNGSPLTEKLNSFLAGYEKIFEDVREEIQSLSESASELEVIANRDKIMEKVSAKIDQLMKSFLEQHPNDVLGAMILCTWVENQIGVTEEKFAEYSGIVGERVHNFGPLKQISEYYASMGKTAVGQPFIDFTIENGNVDGTPASLSDYVGKGKYVLVDFWASWCAPCRIEAPVIAEVYNKYKGDKFEVLGVAVWDKRDATLQSMKEDGHGWPQIIDAQAIPTEIYGIQGIPHIILFGPDGTIVARELRGEKLKSKVAEVMNQ